MKILVTGANGYLGQGVIKQLLDDGENVIATDIRNGNIDQRASIIECNLFDVDDPFSFFGEPDILLHLAWIDGFIHNSTNHINQLPNHFSFISKMINGGVKQVAIMGTMHEIGFFEGCINEYTPCNPLNLYGISKNALRYSTELICKEKNVIFQWLRGYYIVGNSRFGNSIFSKIMSASLEGKKTFPFTTGINQYDFLDYNECCYQIASVVEQKEICGIINVCSGFPERLSNRVERFINDQKLSIHLEYGKYPDRPYDSKAVWGDNTKINKILLNRRKK